MVRRVRGKAKGGEKGKGREGQGGRGREVDSDAQLEQGHRLATAGPAHFSDFTLYSSVARYH